MKGIAMSAQTSFLDIRRQVEVALVDAALKDVDFHDRLVKDPHGTLKHVFGKNPVANFKINVIEEKAGEVTIVLPANTDQSELPDELLDLASGGVSFSAFVLYGPPYDKPAKKK